MVPDSWNVHRQGLNWMTLKDSVLVFSINYDMYTWWDWPQTVWKQIVSRLVSQWLIPLWSLLSNIQANWSFVRGLSVSDRSEKFQPLTGQVNLT